MQDEYVRIILPIDNNFAKLKRTLDSIKRQSYSLENIIVIATIFNKIDEELYLWLLNYPLPHLAVYKRGGELERELQTYEVAKRIADCSSRLRIKYDLELQTGDVLFPDMIEKCVILLRRDSGVGGIICEANLYQKSGEIIQQTPLYDADRMLGRENRLDYLIYGCFHRIFFFEKIKKQEETGKLDTWLYYDDPHFWYCRFLQATSNALLYLKEPLGNIDSDIMKWDCSLKKIMSSYVSVLQFIRTYEYSDEDGICSSQQEKIWENYAHMSLAMSCQLVLQERYREAEDCFLFSRVIWMPIEKNAFYLKIKDKFSLGSKEGWDTIMREIVEAR